jgi:chromosome partitioning protein
MLVIAISTAKGGTTKTTTAVNLACGLAQRGYRVLVADLDGQMHATMLLDDGNGRTRAGEGIDAVFQKQKSLAEVVWPGRYGVHVASSTRASDALPVLEQVNLWLGTQLRREQILATALRRVEHSYDVVLLDCPPARNAIVENAHFAADWLICPVALNTLHYHGIREVAAFAEYVAGEQKPMSVLVSLYRPSCSKMNNRTLQVLEADVASGMYAVFSTRIPFTTELDKAIDSLKPIFEAAPKSSAAHAYDKLVDEVAKLVPQQVAA